MKIRNLLPDFSYKEELFEVDEVYRVDHIKLYEMLTKIKSQDKSINFFLRKKGIEITIGATNEFSRSSILGGMIVSGDNLGKEIADIYLVTFKPIEEVEKTFKPDYKLLELLQEYII